MTCTSENGVVDKTGIPVTSTIWLNSPNASSMRGMSQIGMVAGIPVLSTTTENHCGSSSLKNSTMAPQVSKTILKQATDSLLKKYLIFVKRI